MPTLTLRRAFSPLLIIYVVSFFFTLHTALPVYVNSTFLATLAPERFVGFIYAAASALSILALILVPKLLKSIGDYFATIFFIVFQILALLAIAAFSDSWFVIGLFIASTVLLTLISFDLDLIVEKFSKNANTGSVRGLYFTSANLAWVVAPALAGFLLAGEHFWRVYLAAATILLPALLIFVSKLEYFKDPLYRSIRFRESLRHVLRRADLRNTFILTFLLKFFFTVMVIYTPLYLHDHIGFAWEKLGLIFSIMLVPFLLLEAPLGRIADRWLGEKELLVAGFGIIALATAAMSFFSFQSIAFWAGILFLTRVGAAAVEIMIETYFFKKIDGEEADLVSLQRSVGPFAGMVSPLIATAFLVFLPLSSMFVALGVVMLLGIPISLLIRDTK